jgi:hypothetical protein
MGDTGLNGLWGARDKSRSSSTNSSQFPIFSARVLDIILDRDHNSFEKAGEWNSIGAIKFENAKAPNNSPYGADFTLPTADIFAYPLFPNIKHYPLLQELVIIFFLPSEGVQANSSAGKYYYLPPINVWSSQIQNAIPGIDDMLSQSQKKDNTLVEAGSTNIVVNTTGSNLTLGKTFHEGNYNPLLPFEGDIIYEGRFGNSIRLGSSVNSTTSNIWSNGSIKGTPILILRNGQGSTTRESWEPIVENINNDPSSIYLTQDQPIPLLAASSNQSSFAKSTAPFSPGGYINNQIILNSGRLMFNAKSDSILMLANKSISISTNETVGIDGKQISLSAEKVYLGSAQGVEGVNIHSLVLGENLNLLLEKIAIFAQTLEIAFSTAVDSNGAPIVALSAISEEAGTLYKDILNVINSKNLLSKKVKTV